MFGYVSDAQLRLAEAQVDKAQRLMADAQKVAHDALDIARQCIAITPISRDTDNRELMLLLHDLKSLCERLLDERASPPQLAVVKPTFTPPMRDEVAEAIDLVSGTDSSLARHLHRYAQQQKLDGVREHDIIQAILHWRADEWEGEPSDMPGVL